MVVVLSTVALLAWRYVSPAIADIAVAMAPSHCHESTPSLHSFLIAVVHRFDLKLRNDSATQCLLM